MTALGRLLAVSPHLEGAVCRIRARRQSLVRRVSIIVLTADWHLAYIPSVVVHHHPSALRDATARRRLLLRNGLWCAWLRRPWKSAMYETARLIRTAMHDPARLRGAAEALGAMPWILRNRRVIPPRVEHALQLVQHD